MSIELLSDSAKLPDPRRRWASLLGVQYPEPKPKALPKIMQAGRPPGSTSKRVFSKEDRTIMAKEYEAGRTIRDLTLRFKCGVGAVQRVLQEEGVRIRPAGYQASAYIAMQVPSPRSRKAPRPG